MKIKIHQNVRDASKAVQRGKFIAVNTYTEKGGSQINNLNFHEKELEKEEQIKPKTVRMR